MANFKAGQIIRFTYSHPPQGIDEHTGDRFKEVLVLHPNWQRKVHAVDLKRLTLAEREVLHEVLDPATRESVKAGKRSRIPLVNDIVTRMNPLEEIKNPVSFYSRFIKVFLRNKDAYRQYHPERMSRVTVVKESDVTGKVINPNPLFHKTESKQQPAQPSRLDVIKQRGGLFKKV